MTRDERKRNPPRGILTQPQKDKLQKGNINRQTISNIRSQTMQALAIDLPLIFNKIGVVRLSNAIPPKWKKTLIEIEGLLTEKSLSERG